MKLEASPRVEKGVGMAQIQIHLANLTLQLHDIKKGKETIEEVWCTKCRTKGHSKQHCPIFADYLSTGEPNPLPQATPRFPYFARQDARKKTVDR